MCVSSFMSIYITFGHPLIIVSVCLPHPERMHRIATGIFSALTDAMSENPACRATD